MTLLLDSPGKNCDSVSPTLDCEVSDAISEQQVTTSPTSALTTSTAFESPAISPAKSIRYPWIDAVKGIAAIVIMAHHITLYSPYSDLTDEFAGAITIPLYNHGPLAVQIFMVFGGFALAVSLPSQLSLNTMGSTLLGRYLRLAVPYAAMLATLLICWRIFGADMNHPMIEEFSWGHIASHLFFVQDLLGYGNLSAGTWYLCIDVQYIVLCLAILWTSTIIAEQISCASKSPLFAACCLAGLGTVSAWYWNLNPNQDCWVIYFLATLVLGTLLGLWMQDVCPTWLVVAYCGSLLASQVLEFRLRIVVGLLTGTFLVLSAKRAEQANVPRWLTWLGKISYSLFLIHYVISSLVLHLAESWVDANPFRAFIAMLLAMAASLIAAWALNVAVEQPTQRAIKRWLSSKSCQEARVSRQQASPRPL